MSAPRVNLTVCGFNAAALARTAEQAIEQAGVRRLDKIEALEAVCLALGEGVAFDYDQDCVSITIDHDELARRVTAHLKSQTL